MMAAYPGHSSADLARVALLTPQTVSVIVANLEQARLIRRRPHAVHGRILQLQITAAGRKLLATCRERAMILESQLGAGLTASEKRIVKRWLVSVATHPTGPVLP